MLWAGCGGCAVVSAGPVIKSAWLRACLGALCVCRTLLWVHCVLVWVFISPENIVQSHLQTNYCSSSLEVGFPHLLGR